MDRHEPEPEVTSTGKHVLDNPLVAFLFGAAAALGGGSLGAQVPPKSAPPEPMTARQQVLLAVTVYGPFFGVPLIVWLVTRNLVRTAVWTGLIWVGLFFVAVLTGAVVAYARTRKGSPRDSR